MPAIISNHQQNGLLPIFKKSMVITNHHIQLSPTHQQNHRPKSPDQKPLPFKSMVQIPTIISNNYWFNQPLLVQSTMVYYQPPTKIHRQLTCRHGSFVGSEAAGGHMVHDQRPQQVQVRTPGDAAKAWVSG